MTSVSCDDVNAVYEVYVLRNKNPKSKPKWKYPEIVQSSENVPTVYTQEDIKAHIEELNQHLFGLIHKLDDLLPSQRNCITAWLQSKVDKGVTTKSQVEIVQLEKHLRRVKSRGILETTSFTIFLKQSPQRNSSTYSQVAPVLETVDLGPNWNLGNGNGLHGRREAVDECTDNLRPICLDALPSKAKGSVEDCSEPQETSVLGKFRKGVARLSDELEEVVVVESDKDEDEDDPIQSIYGVNNTFYQYFFNRDIKPELGDVIKQGYSTGETCNHFESNFKEASTQNLKQQSLVTPAHTRESSTASETSTSTFDSVETAQTQYSMSSVEPELTVQEKSELSFQERGYTLPLRGKSKNKKANGEPQQDDDWEDVAEEFPEIYDNLIKREFGRPKSRRGGYEQTVFIYDAKRRGDWLQGRVLLDSGAGEGNLITKAMADALHADIAIRRNDYLYSIDDLKVSVLGRTRLVFSGEGKQARNYGEEFKVVLNIPGGFDMLLCQQWMLRHLPESIPHCLALRDKKAETKEDIAEREQRKRKQEDEARRQEKERQAQLLKEARRRGNSACGSR